MESRGKPQFRAEDMPGSAIHIYTSESDFGTEAAAFTSTQRHRPIGFMDIGLQGQVGTIYVHPRFRRKGIATRMYEAAGRPPHSAELTEMGAAWSQKVGGEQHTERGEQRVKAEPLHETAHEVHVLPVAAGAIRAEGKRSRSGEFSGHRLS